MDYIKAHQESAPIYDQQAKEWGWNPEVFFGLMYEYSQPEDLLLDVGIGTGLCAQPFHKAGLEVYGFDGSDKMLKICASKKITTDLKQHNISDIPWPYADNMFNHVVCGGVFHFFGELISIFREIGRALKDGGAFGFLVSPLTSVDIAGSNLDEKTDFAKVPDEASGEKIYKHSHYYITNILKATGFSLEKELVFLASVNPETKKEHYGKLYIGLKTT